MPYFLGALFWDGGELKSLIHITQNLHGILELLFFSMYWVYFLPIKPSKNNMRITLILSLALLILYSGCSPDSNSNISEIKSPAKANSSLPRLFTDNTGTVFMSWVEEIEHMAHLKYATLQGDVWSEPETIIQDSTWFINWADFPSLIAQNGQPMAAHWLNKVEGGTYAYHVNMATYDSTWNNSFTPHKDGSPTEHGFVSMTPATDSTFFAIWLDGRQTMNRNHNEYSDLDKAMTLRGAFINTNSEIEQRFLIDESVCDCCNTAVTKTDKGFIAAYRDRTNDEIRDIYVTSFVDGSWSKPIPVHSDNWEIAACPVNGPSIDAKGSTVAVAWFTGARGDSKVKMALSQDYGQTFDEPILLDDKNPSGRVDLNITKDKIWVSWLSSSNDGSDLKIHSYAHDGDRKSEYALSNLPSSRSTGFPQISVRESGLLISYTDVTGDRPQVKTYVLE